MDRSEFAQIIRRLSNVHRPGSQPNLCVMSMPRSGSTWLLEILTAQRHTKPCNEPLNVRKPVVREHLGISDWEELLDPRRLPEVERYLQRYIDGSFAFKNLRPFQRGYSFYTTRVVFKILFGLESQLAWVRERIDAKIVALVRHPIAVSASRTEFPRLGALLQERTSRLSESQLALAQRTLRHGSAMEKKMLDWCLQALPILDDLNSVDLLVTYEQLVLEPAKVIDHLIDALELRDEKRLRKAAGHLSRSVFKSSSESRDVLADRGADAMQVVAKWKANVSEQCERELMRYPERFGIDLYTAGEYLPARSYWLR